MARKLPLIMLQGLIGLLVGAWLFLHKCEKGIQLIEHVMPFVVMLGCAVPALMCKKPYYNLLATCIVLVLAYYISRLYMNAYH
jgi:hypothetical protein